MPSFILPDVLQPQLAIVFCGTAAGTESARQAAYYAHPQNRFWRALHEAGLTPRRLAPSEFPTLPDYGLGLTDIAKTASGMDRELPSGALGRDACATLEAKILEFSPKVLAFTSLTAGAKNRDDDDLGVAFALADGDVELGSGAVAGARGGARRDGGIIREERMRTIVWAAALFASAAMAGEADPDRPAYWGSPSVDGGKCCATLGEVRAHRQHRPHDPGRDGRARAICRGSGALQEGPGGGERSRAREWPR
jgi:hypothetical protein